MPEAFLVSGVRTPHGKYGGQLSTVRPDDLAGLVVAELVRRARIPGDAVELNEAFAAQALVERV